MFFHVWFGLVSKKNVDRQKKIYTNTHTIYVISAYNGYETPLYDHRHRPHKSLSSFEKEQHTTNYEKRKEEWRKK